MDNETNGDEEWSRYWAQFVKQLDLTDAKGELTAHWINIDTGEFGPKEAIQGGGKLELSSPGKENWAAAIVVRR